MTTNPLLMAPTIENELTLTFGAWLICACVACMLYGLTTHQTYRYFRLYPNDSIGLKSLVAAVLYYYLVQNYLNPAALSSGVWSLRISITETAVMMLLSHSFFVRRIFLLGERRVVPVIIITLLMLIGFAFALAATIKTFLLVTFEGFKSHMWMIWVLLASAVLIDVVVTAFLMYFLWKSRTGYKRTDSILEVLMVYTINTGLSTTMLTIPAMICSIVMPGNLLWSSIYVVASKMYANSLLAVLNSRRSLRDRGAEGFETGSFGLEVFDPREMRTLNPKTTLRPKVPLESKELHTPNLKAAETVIDIKVTTETFVDITDNSEHGHRDRHDPEAKGNTLQLIHADGRSDDQESLQGWRTI